MIQHIVLIRFKKDVSREEIADMFAAIAAVREVVPGIRSITSGRSLELEKLEKGFRDGFVVEFEDRAALDAYQAHPDHRAAGARLVAAAEGGLDGILVFDLES